MFKRFGIKWWHGAALVIVLTIGLVSASNISSWFDRPSLSEDEVSAYVWQHLPIPPFAKQPEIESRASKYLGNGKWSIRLFYPAYHPQVGTVPSENTRVDRAGNSYRLPSDVVPVYADYWINGVDEIYFYEKTRVTEYRGYYSWQSGATIIVTTPSTETPAYIWVVIALFFILVIALIILILKALSKRKSPKID